MVRSWKRVGFLLSVLMASGSSAVVAQAPEPSPEQTPTAESAGPSEAELAQARQRFRDGVEAAEARDYRRAVRAFRQALAVRDAPAVRYNLASALFEVGEHVESFAMVRGLGADTPADLRERADRLERELRRHVAILNIRIGGQLDSAQLDGRTLEPSEHDRPLAVAPGPHELLGLRGAEVITTRRFELAAGAEVYVDVSSVPTPAEAAQMATPAAAPPSLAPPVATEAPRSRKGLWIGLAIGAAVVIGAAVTVGVVASRGPADPVPGNFEPGVIRW
ncbi:MAG: hypothetical protein KF901_24720 [Myxococcales bacterium]|nr:hypothetical protein [Myxococcales bacterium]